MNNENLSKILGLIEDYTEHFREECYANTAYLGRNEDYEFDEEDRQPADFENEHLEADEFVTQTSVGDSGDWFEGIIVRKIKNTNFCLVIEYST